MKRRVAAFVLALIIGYDVGFATAEYLRKDIK